MELEELEQLNSAMRGRIEQVVIGQSRAVELLLVAMLAGGHVLLEGVPGTAKTLLARTFASLLSMEFARIQFTPDLLPADLIGTNLFDFQTSTFTMTRGPLFTEMLLADEINRTPPKTQAALLEAMQERGITVDGETHDLGPGFMVIATQNPIEQEGTYPLPEAQLDRFLFKIEVGYPSRDDERALVRRHGHRAGMPELSEFGVESIVELPTILAARELVRRVELSDPMIDYAVDLVRATRSHPSLVAGASPRSCTMLTTAARARAALHGRGYVIPDDVKALVDVVLGHRLIMSPAAEIEGRRAPAVLEDIVRQIPAPR